MGEVVLGIIILALLIWHWHERRDVIHEHQNALAAKGDEYQELLKQQRLESDAVISNLEEIIKTLSKERQGDKENTSKLINALVGKTTAEVRDLNLTDKIGAFKNMTQPEVPPDMVPVEQLSQEEWEQHVLGKQPEGEEEVTE